MVPRITRQKELVGLDIGTSSVKAVHLQQSRSAYKLADLGIARIHPETIVDGIIMDAATVSTAIRQLFDKHGIAIKDVAFSVSGHSVIIKKIKVPKMKKAELAWGREGRRVRECRLCRLHSPISRDSSSAPAWGRVLSAQPGYRVTRRKRSTAHVTPVNPLEPGGQRLPA